MTATTDKKDSAMSIDPQKPALNWINGKWVDSKKHTNSINPATGEVIGIYADGGREEAVQATNAAVQAFRKLDWKDNRALRARVLNQIADRFEARREDLIGILSLENGKVYAEAAFEVDIISCKFRYWASVVLQLHSKK
ncbi:aldehyde dehydrogenase family protein [uncultured Nostoc sp.]|uniref:aldehyde dehydrogenase family protein n=1 Tax=uncultured Nostoc sp. TaxID=340711 RepID=UPI0035CB9C0A